MDTHLWSLIFGSLLFPLVVLLGLEWIAGRVPFFGKWLAAPFHWLRTKYIFVLMWPFKKLWALMSAGAKKMVAAAWRGFVIVIKRLLAAAWRGVKIIFAALWSRLGGTP